MDKQSGGRLSTSFDQAQGYSAAPDKLNLRRYYRRLPFLKREYLLFTKIIGLCHFPCGLASATAPQRKMKFASTLQKVTDPKREKSTPSICIFLSIGTVWTSRTAMCSAPLEPDSFMRRF